MAVQVRRIRADEGTLLRDLRLAALRDAPFAFESSFETESHRPGEVWDADATARSEGPLSATFIAEWDGRVAGLVGAYRSPEAPGTVELVSLWVEPAARGHGLAQSLVQAITQWAAAVGSTRVNLWVMRGNDRAIALYEKLAFVPADAGGDQRGHPCEDELRMTRVVAGAPTG